MRDVDAAMAKWNAAGPLSNESLQHLLELREAASKDHPQELLWAAFVRSLSSEQRAAALAMVEMADDGTAFRML